MSADELITTSVQHRDGVVVLTVRGDVDALTAPILETAINDVLADDPSALVIDLTEVQFFGSAGLRALLQAKDKVTGPARLAVVTSSPVTTRPIEITGLDDTLSLYKTLDDALMAVGDRKDSG